MYSGSAFTVTGGSSSAFETLSPCDSNAEANDLSEMAVWGSEVFSRLSGKPQCMFRPFGSKATSDVFCSSPRSGPLLATGANGFRTSLATLIITSKFEASALEGSRKRNTKGS